MLECLLLHWWLLRNRWRSRAELSSKRLLARKIIDLHWRWLLHALDCWPLILALAII